MKAAAEDSSPSKVIARIILEEEGVLVLVGERGGMKISADQG
jgi:hypothetical protein